MHCTCHIVPKDVLHRLSHDTKLGGDSRQALAHSAAISTEMRKLRTQQLALTGVAEGLVADLTAISDQPAVTVFDCVNKTTLPGSPVNDPGYSKDESAQRAFEQTTQVVQFLQQSFGRNSIDAAGMTLVSSVHYGRRYANAMWNGSQMIYGDGDGEIFVDFTRGNDVIGHELTHGITQYTLRLEYEDDAGGLNESMSDCFGTMFRQWQAKQDVSQGDWLIGREIMGPAAHARGLICLRDMSKPGADHCLAPQPSHYSQLTPGMDPHYSSGPPNLAFYLACTAVGGKSWETIGQVWYRAMVSGASPNMKMTEFANRTRQMASQLFGAQPTVVNAVDAAWKRVGL